MAYEVELGYRNAEGDFVEIDIERREVSLETITKIDAPLATNIVGYKKLVDT